MGWSLLDQLLYVMSFHCILWIFFLVTTLIKVFGKARTEKLSATFLPTILIMLLLVFPLSHFLMVPLDFYFCYGDNRYSFLCHRWYAVGISAAIGYFTFTLWSRKYIMVFIFGMSVLSMGCYSLTHYCDPPKITNRYV